MHGDIYVWYGKLSKLHFNAWLSSDCRETVPELITNFFKPGSESATYILPYS